MSFSLGSAKEFIEFVNKACTPFHAVQTVSQMLRNAGFTQLEEGSNWPELSKCGKYFVTRNDSSIVVLTVGGKYEPSHGLKIVGAHTDSPNLALKPKMCVSGGKYQQVAVQCYGGGLWHTWFDRDLTVAGRVIIGREKLETAFVRLTQPIMSIPTLAIHLRSSAEREAFGFNKEKHLVPIIASAVAETVNEGDQASRNSANAAPLIKSIAEVASCTPDEIVDFDLSVIDTQDATIGGINNEFIYSPRLDNLVSCFCAVKALLEEDCSLSDETMIRMVCLFDHEEIGSSSSQGAGGTLVPDVIERLTQQGTLRATLVANSFLLSVDGAHAVHPNYPDKHESNHSPHLNKGPVLKYNANVRYATNGFTGAVVKQLARKASVPIQEFVVRNDSPCGSTIGPILSTLSGIKTADIGNSMLSMHSIREMCGSADIEHLINLIKSFFKNYKN